MQMIKIALRNNLRNKRRTFLAGLSIAIGLAAMILMDGFTRGIIIAMVKEATSASLGGAQIHHRDYSDDYDIDKAFELDPSVKQRIEAFPNLKSYSMRTKFMAMIASAIESNPVMVYGVNPEKEAYLSKFQARIQSGTMLSSTEPNKLLLGDRLSKKLGVGVGDRLVLSGSRAYTGEMTQELFRVSGIFKMGSKQFDEGVVVIPIERAQKTFNLENQYHELVLGFDRQIMPNQAPPALELANSNLKFEFWYDLMPALKSMIEMSRFSLTIVGSILFLLVALGVLNTLFMSIYERMREYGIIKAIGASKNHVRKLILTEALVLGLLATPIGLAIASVFAFYLMTQGISFAGAEYSQVSLGEPIYFVFHWSQFVIFPVWAIALTMIAAAYPAWHASQLHTIDAIHNRKA